jgi:hypothetical protein
MSNFIFDIELTMASSHCSISAQTRTGHIRLLERDSHILRCILQLLDLRLQSLNKDLLLW